MNEDLPSNPQSDANFEQNRHDYFVALALAHRDLFQLHIDSVQTQRSENFGRDELDRPKRLGDPTEHWLVEAAASETLSDMLGLSEDEKETFVAAAFVHDWRKRGEIEETRGVSDPALIEDSYAKSKEGLRAARIPGAVIHLTECVAHTSLPDMAELDADNNIVLKDNVPLLDLAMHYLDDVTRGTQLVDLDTRMDYLDSMALTRYPYNEEGRALWGGRTFFEAQRQVGHMVEARLAGITGVEDPLTLPAVITDKLVERINAAGEQAA